MSRRGSAAVAVADTRDADLARAELRRVQDELESANARADRMQRERDNAQAALRDTADDVAALHERALPNLADLHDGFDEPIPEDARVTKRGDWVRGTWEDVPGDRGEDYGLVEAVDFGALYALIGAELVAA